MTRLTAQSLKGIWAAITMAWDEDFAFDEISYVENTRRLIRSRVDGIFTTGSTGEFYALEYDEFRRMVDLQAALCGEAGMPLQIGCCADATAKTLRLFEYACRHPQVGAVQVTVPYWMEMTDREVLRFFKDVHTACPQMPLVHYNIPRAKRFLHAADYRRILDVAPSLIGVKYTFAGSHFGNLQADLAQTPELSFFVGEDLLVSGMLLGVRGSYSSLVSTRPAFMLEMFEKAGNGRWEEAIVMQKRASAFFRELDEWLGERCEGGIDPVADKGLSVAAGFFTGSQRCRAPYIGWSDETVSLLRVWLRERYPEFLSDPL